MSPDEREAVRLRLVAHLRGIEELLVELHAVAYGGGRSVVRMHEALAHIGPTADASAIERRLELAEQAHYATCPLGGAEADHSDCYERDQEGRRHAWDWLAQSSGDEFDTALWTLWFWTDDLHRDLGIEPSGTVTIVSESAFLRAHAEQLHDDHLVACERDIAGLRAALENLTATGIRPTFTGLSCSEPGCTGRFERWTLPRAGEYVLTDWICSRCYTSIGDEEHARRIVAAERWDREGHDEAEDA